MGWKDWHWSDADDQEMTELYAALGMKYRPRQRQASSERERIDECVVLRPSFPANRKPSPSASAEIVYLRSYNHARN